MRLFRLFPAFVFIACLSPAWAQQSQEPVSQEELMKYAVAMDSINSMTQDLLQTITEMVKENEKISAARYNELSKIIEDETKLTEANATPEEIAAVKEVVAVKMDGTAKIQETFRALANDYVGAAVYNKVRSALASDQELKSKYEAILTELKKDDSE